MHIHTHYDNLQLSQDASAADIRQAYRRLSKRYHPDLNNDPDAHRIMQLVNRAYEILSNPASRAEHDRWIAAQYRRRFEAMVPRAQPITYYTTEDEIPANNSKKTQIHLLIGLLIISVLLLSIALWQGWDWLKRNSIQNGNLTHNNTPTIVQIQVNPSPNNTRITSESTNNHYIRPDTAPNGAPWPKESDYIASYPKIEGMGNSTIIADNVRNSSDVFAQLYEKNSQQALRTFFLKERQQFPLKQLDAGEYFIRYHQLDNGEHLDSESIIISNNQQRATIYLQRGKAPQPYIINP